MSNTFVNNTVSVLPQVFTRGSITVPVKGGGIIEVNLSQDGGNLSGAGALQNQEATYAYTVMTLNTALVDVANTIRTGTNTAIEAGQTPHEVLPNSFVLILPANGGPGGYEQTGPPVQPTIPLSVHTGPDAPAGPNHIHVGAQISGAWYQAADDDTVASGQTVLNAEDGHLYLKWANPFRKQGLYQQVG